MSTLQELQSRQAAAAIAYEVANMTGPETKRQATLKAYDETTAALIEYLRSI